MLQDKTSEVTGVAEYIYVSLVALRWATAILHFKNLSFSIVIFNNSAHHSYLRIVDYFFDSHKKKNLTAVIWAPPLYANVEFVAGRYVCRQCHTLVVDVLLISHPKLAECAWWNLKPQTIPDTRNVGLKKKNVACSVF